MTDQGFIKFRRSSNALELMKRPKSFVLLALVARRARRSGEANLHGLRAGEALIGDHGTVGLSQREYRTAKTMLSRLGLATFHGTSRGTVATLVDNSIFDINLVASDELGDEQATSKRRASDEQATTNKNGKNEKKKKNETRKMEAYRKMRSDFLRTNSVSQVSYHEIRNAS